MDAVVGSQKLAFLVSTRSWRPNLRSIGLRVVVHESQLD